MKELKLIDAMEFKVGDHVKCSQQPICVIIGFNSSNWPIVILHGEEAALNPKFTSLCLPEKWAIKTDRQEFWDYYKDYCDTKSSEYYHHFPAFGNLESEFGKYHADIYVYRGYTEITFEYWCRVHRPDLLSCSEIPDNSIPEKWCVRRTPKNAEVLNAWYKSKRPDKWLTSFDLYISNDLDFYHNPIVDYPEITYEQWKTIPEVVEWLKSSRFSEEETKRLDNLYSMYDVVSPHGLLLINQQRHFVVTNSEEKKLFSVSVQPKPVEEREIEGYKAPFDMFGSQCKKGQLYVPCNDDPKYYYPKNFPSGSALFLLPIELLACWEPVYKEAPKFKGGDWVVYENVITKTFQILRVTELGLEGDIGMYAKRFCRFATPEEIEKATFKPVWERFPTLESLGDIEGSFLVGSFASIKHAESALAFSQLSQIEKAWNEGKEGTFTVKYNPEKDCLDVIEAIYYKAHINFATEKLANKSIELPAIADLWRKFWMV